MDHIYFTFFAVTFSIHLQTYFPSTTVTLSISHLYLLLLLNCLTRWALKSCARRGRPMFSLPSQRWIELRSSEKWRWIELRSAEWKTVSRLSEFPCLSKKRLGCTRWDVRLQICKDGNDFWDAQDAGPVLFWSKISNSSVKYFGPKSIWSILDQNVF